MMERQNASGISISEEALELPLKWGWLLALAIEMLLNGFLLKSLALTMRRMRGDDYHQSGDASARVNRS